MTEREAETQVVRLLASPRSRYWPAAANPGNDPVFAWVSGRKIAADEPVTVQRRNPAQRTGCRCRHRPASKQEAFPHVHLFVVGYSDRTDHRPDSQP